MMSPILRGMGNVARQNSREIAQDIIQQRIALEEDGAESSGLEDELRGAIEIVAPSYVELLLTAEEQDLEPPVFMVGGEEYAVYAEKLLFSQHRWRRRWQDEHVLACTVHETNVGWPAFLLPCPSKGKDAPLKKWECFRPTPAPREILTGFANSSERILAQLRSASRARRDGARTGLGTIEQVHLALLS